MDSLKSNHKLHSMRTSWQSPEERQRDGEILSRDSYLWEKRMGDNKNPRAHHQQRDGEEECFAFAILATHLPEHVDVQGGMRWIT